MADLLEWHLEALVDGDIGAELELSTEVVGEITCAEKEVANLEVFDGVGTL